ncbi:MAG: hypothetical protein M3209_19880 [Acidobacteriota bacterium]|nr:hypothetical protein [Acidobacteriota bacterium]
MDKKDSLITHDPGWLKDISDSQHDGLQPFAPEQMVECSACRRPNPPTRLNCFYCGKQLEISEKNEKLVRPIFRKLENWEKGFNVFCFSKLPGELSRTDLQAISLFLGFEPEIFNNFLEFGFPLPVSRLETAEEAQIVENRLKDFNLSAFIIPDEDLSPEKPPRRVRALEFSDNLTIRFTGTNETQTLNWNDLKVFVEGRIFESRRELLKQRKKGEAKEIGEASEYSNDERVVDFYDSENFSGFRISSKSFDFSCLGAKKSWLANENFENLLDELNTRAPEAVFDRNYKTVRSLLNQVWETDERRDSTGFQHVGIGKLNLANTVTTNNQTQFTRYSRLIAFWEKRQRQK